MRTIVLMLCLMAGAASTADALRCGSRVVSKGDHKTDVRHKCGEPLSIEERVLYPPHKHSRQHPPNHRQHQHQHRRDQRHQYQQEHPHASHMDIPITIEEWIYNFGPRKLMQKLQFENGKLIDIDSLGYGYLTR